MYGAPGTAMASLAMWRETGDAIWVERFRRDIGRFWAQLRPCVDTDCLIWEQELGQLASHLGAVHGFAGNLLPVIQGWSLLSTEEQSDWSACIERTLRATAFAKESSPTGPSLKEGTALAGQPSWFNTVTAHQEL
jgi:hypothetical protein